MTKKNTKTPITRRAGLFKIILKVSAVFILLGILITFTPLKAYLTTHFTSTPQTPITAEKIAPVPTDKTEVSIFKMGVDELKDKALSANRFDVMSAKLQQNFLQQQAYTSFFIDLIQQLRGSQHIQIHEGWIQHLDPALKASIHKILIDHHLKSYMRAPSVHRLNVKLKELTMLAVKPGRLFDARRYADRVLHHMRNWIQIEKESNIEEEKEDATEHAQKTTIEKSPKKVNSFDENLKQIQKALHRYKLADAETLYQTLPKKTQNHMAQWHRHLIRRINFDNAIDAIEKELTHFWGSYLKKNRP